MKIPRNIAEHWVMWICEVLATPRHWDKLKPLIRSRRMLTLVITQPLYAAQLARHTDQDTLWTILYHPVFTLLADKLPDYINDWRKHKRRIDEQTHMKIENYLKTELPIHLEGRSPPYEDMFSYADYVQDFRNRSGVPTILWKDGRSRISIEAVPRPPKSDSELARLHSSIKQATVGILPSIVQKPIEERGEECLTSLEKLQRIFRFDYKCKPVNMPFSEWILLRQEDKSIPFDLLNEREMDKTWTGFQAGLLEMLLTNEKEKYYFVKNIKKIQENNSKVVLQVQGITFQRINKLYLPVSKIFAVNNQRNTFIICMNGVCNSGHESQLIRFCTQIHKE